MKTIIAATDFSDIARNAVYYAADMATSLQARLILYHVVENNTAAMAGSPVVAIGEYYTDEAFIQLEKLKDELVASTDNAIDVQVKLRWGNAGSEMEQLSYEEKPFAIVMAAGKKYSLEKILTGSRILNISHRCHTPLLLIPEDASFKRLNTIAIATDLADVVNSIPLQELTHWIKNFTCQLEIVNVAPANGMKGENAAEAIAMETHFKELIPQFRYLTNDDAAAGLYAYAKKSKPNLLIIIPKKHGWFHKSLSKQLMLYPTVPLLVMPKHVTDCSCL